MSQARRSFLMLLMVIGLTLASLVAIALKPAVLGLDLQGGVEVILEGRPTSEAAVNQDSLSRAVEVIRNRVDRFGVSEPEIQTQGTNQIVVALPGEENAQDVVKNLIRPAQLAFYDFQDSVEGAPSRNLWATVTRAEGLPVNDPGKGAERLYAFVTATKRPVMDRSTNQPIDPVVVEPGKAAEARTELLKAVRDAGVRPRDITIKSVPRGLIVVREITPVLQSRPDGAKTTQYYVFQDNPGLTGNDISRASSVRDVGQGGSGEPIVTMDFTDAGGDKFKDITATLASRGAAAQQLQSFAVVLDGEMISNPTIDYNELPFGIDGGAARIMGNFTSDSARTLADQLNSGAIPIRLVPVSLKQVDATIGEQSLRQGVIAGIVGLALVMAFLIAYYRVLGLVAALALLIYGALYYAAVVLVPITLTLPGIAGVILTIGVAADANVIIFERVREEGRKGKSAAAAMAAGYKKGIAAIIDANVVTLATALIVFLFATGGPRGFAFTLAVGVLLSLFTAVVATRAIFGVMANSKFLREDRYTGLREGRVPSFDWVGHWRWWAAITIIPMLFGLGWLGVKGLNMGLDFESGTSITTSYTKPVSEQQVRNVMSDAGVTDARVQGTTQTIDGRAVQGYQIRTEPLSPETGDAVIAGLRDQLGLTILTRDDVGPTFGRQIINNAIQAIVLSFIIVALYLVLRFEYKLAVPAMLSVVHDVLLSVGIYSVLGHEVTSATVAAMLTILGYSLYDVVIVFDRIRENVPLMRGSRYRDVVNRSVNETFTRSLITSLTTLVPVLALYFFGGDQLKDFSLALLVGILAGGVSSIIIAAPLASFWKEREPADKKLQAKAKRRAAVSTIDADVVDVDVLARAERALDSRGGAAPALGSGLAEMAPARELAEGLEDEDAGEDADVGDATASSSTRGREADPAPAGDDPAQADPAPDGEDPATGKRAPGSHRPTGDRQRRHRRIQERRRRT
ncbi:MAG: protein translocase subunit SecD [Thermoleophilia bacterium]|nr:protein translocase subunit SecD [Thermoleophilia bacterium]